MLVVFAFAAVLHRRVSPGDVIAIAASRAARCRDSVRTTLRGRVSRPSAVLLRADSLPRPGRSGLLLALVIFVPKWNDIGGVLHRHVPRPHKMTPLLSPKKTWEGLRGRDARWYAGRAGLSPRAPDLSGGVAGSDRHSGWRWAWPGFSATWRNRSSSATARPRTLARSIPGFGGLLDVVDSVLFAAPVAYLWFTWSRYYVAEGT